MQSIILKYLLPAYIAIILLDLNEFVTRYLGSEGVLTLLIFAMSLFLIIGSKPLSRGGGKMNRVFLTAFLGYITFGGMVSIIQGDIQKLVSEVRYYFPSLLIYFAVFRAVRSVKNASEIYRFISVAAIIIGLNGIFILISILFNVEFHINSDATQVERAVGLYSNANRAGYVSDIGQSLALLLLFSRQVKYPRFYFGLYILCLLAAISTFSKGAILLSLLMLLRVLYLGISLKNQASGKLIKKYVRQFSVLLILLIIPLSLGFFNVQSRLSSLQTERLDQLSLLLQGQIDENTTTHRTDLASYAIDKMQATFFLGAGLGEFKKMEIGYGTHNIYLLILGEAGIFALILYAYYLLTWAIRSFSKTYFSAIKFASGNIMILVFFSGFAAHTLLANKPYVLTLALIFGALRIRELVPEARL